MRISDWSSDVCSSDLYERRAELVPKLVNSVNAYMVNERAVLTQVTDARSKVGSVQISATDLENPELMPSFEQAQGLLSSALSRLIAVSHNYPQLKREYRKSIV